MRTHRGRAFSLRSHRTRRKTYNRACSLRVAVSVDFVLLPLEFGVVEMGYHLRTHEDVQEGVRRIASEQIQKAIREIDDSTMDRHEVVHRLRKRCKKLRGLLRLVRPELEDVYASENAFFRDLSRELSFVRDSQALIEAWDRLAEASADVSSASVALVREYLTHLREKVTGEDEDLNRRLEPVRESLQQSLARVSTWTLRDGGFDAVEGGLMQNYRRARKAMRHAYEASASEFFHEWRKRVKYHWHHARLLRNISPRLMRPHRRMAAELGELLGQDHDLAVLKQRLIRPTDCPPSISDNLW